MMLQREEGLSKRKARAQALKEIGPKAKIDGMALDPPPEMFPDEWGIASGDFDAKGQARGRTRNMDFMGMGKLLRGVLEVPWRGIGPTDAVEALLAVQMAAVHQASIQAARRLGQADTLEQKDSASTSFNKLTRTFTMQVEALKRHRSAGEQKVVVEHVHVYPGGQAVVGNVSQQH